MTNTPFGGLNDSLDHATIAAVPPGSIGTDTGDTVCLLCGLGLDQKQIGTHASPCAWSGAPDQLVLDAVEVAIAVQRERSENWNKGFR